MRRKMLQLAIVAIIVLSIGLYLTLLVLRDKPGEMMKEAIKLRKSESITEAANLFGQTALLYPDSKHADDALYERGLTYYVFAFPEASKDEKSWTILFDGLYTRKDDQG